jgi:hypothetical protein
MGLGANIMPAFEQLGLYEEFNAISYPTSGVEFLYGSMKKIASLRSNSGRDT